MADSLYDQFQVNLSSYIDLANTSGKATQEVLAKQGAAAKDIANLMMDIGKNQVIKTESEAAEQLKLQERNLATALAAGINPALGIDKIDETIAKQAKANEQLQGSLEKLNEIDNLGFMDFIADPMGVAKAKLFDRSGVETQVAQSAAMAKVLHSSVVEINKSMESKFQTNAAIKQTLTAAGADAAIKNVAIAAQIQAREADIKAFDYNLKAIDSAQKMSGEVLNARLQGLSAQSQQTNLGLAIRASQRAEESHSMEMQLRNDQILESKENRAAQEITLAKYNAGARAAGKPEVAMGEFKAKRDFWGKGGVEDDSYLYKIGSKILEGQNTNNYDGLYGNTAAEAAENLKKFKPRLGPDAEKTVALIKRAEEALAAKAKIGSGLEDKKEFQEARATFINDHVARELKNFERVVPGDMRNPLNFGSLANYATLPGFKSTPLMRDVLAPAAAEGVDIENPQVLYSLMAKAISDKKMNSGDLVKQFVEMNKKAYVANYSSKQMDRLGNLKVSKEAPRYMQDVKMELNDPWGASFTAPIEINALDETSVNAALARMLAEKWRK